MPCHPDRVRRNYHDVKIKVGVDPARLQVRAEIVISHEAIATAMTAREVKATFARFINDGIERAYGQT